MHDTASLRVPDEAELVAILAAAIRQGGGGRMSRVADAFLAGLCAEHLVERMALAGLVCLLRTPAGGGQGGGDVAG